MHHLRDRSPWLPRPKKECPEGCGTWWELVPLIAKPSCRSLAFRKRHDLLPGLLSGLFTFAVSAARAGGYAAIASSPGQLIMHAAFACMMPSVVPPLVEPPERSSRLFPLWTVAGSSKQALASLLRRSKSVSPFSPWRLHGVARKLSSYLPASCFLPPEESFKRNKFSSQVHAY